MAHGLAKAQADGLEGVAAREAARAALARF